MLQASKFGLAGGLLWGVSIFFLTVLSIHTNYAPMLMQLLLEIYPGFSVSWTGAFFGMIIGFLDAFLFFYLLAFLYNKFAKAS